MHHAFKLQDAELNVGLSRARFGYCLHVDGRSIPIDLHREDDGSVVLTVLGHSERITVATLGDDVLVHLDGTVYELRYLHPLERLAVRLHGVVADEVRSPMPGSLVAMHVRPGQRVGRGETLLVMESMKMETTISAPRDGIVEAVQFSVGQSFERDAVLLSLIAPENGA